MHRVRAAFPRSRTVPPALFRAVQATALVSSLLVAAAASAQSIGGGASVSGGASAAGGGVAAPISPSPNAPGITSGANALGSVEGASPGESGLAQENNWDLPVDLQPNSGSSSGDTSASTQATATAGSTNFNSVNAGSVATSGDPSTASATGATSIGGSTLANDTSRRRSIAGAGRPEDYVIPKPQVGVSLVSIRVALGSGSTATPRANGD